MSKSLRGGAYSTEVSPLVRLWILRILINLSGHGEFISVHGFSNDSLAKALGLGRWVDDDLEPFSSRAALVELRQMLQNAERAASKFRLPSLLSKNIERLSDLVGLSSTDCRILAFAVGLHNERMIDDSADCLGQLSSLKVIHALSVILDIPEKDVRNAFRAEAVLARSGLLQVDRSGVGTLRGKLNLLSDGFADRLAASEADPVSLMQGTISAVQSGHLSKADYGHVQDSLDILVPYLEFATTTGRRGVNILIHGAPGTGKSQLARVLAKELDCELFEVASEDEDGDPIQGRNRLRAFRAGQYFLAQRRALILFDEAEDVFNDADTFLGGRSTAQIHKAWLNRALEDSPIPTLWLSNAIEGMDPAFIRRFDMVFELPVPPMLHRENIIRQVCGDLVDEDSTRRLTKIEVLAPAVVSRASSVVRAIASRLNNDQRVKALEHLIDNTLEAQGHSGVQRYTSHDLLEVYDPAFIRTDANLEQVATALKHARAGRLCLYGPPGTGKTAYGRWLADQLNVPLLVQRASDLLSMWLGETEKNLARAFRKAEKEGAVLLIDEVDSFLQDRRGASKGWEVTGVNEMLTQMESFSGLFIATTNLISGLDQAALRRFDLKVKFDYLLPTQSLELLHRYCSCLGLGEPEDACQQAMLYLQNLTPGDFATATRQHRFRPITSAVQLVETLRAECMFKESAPPAIGFLT